MTTNNMENPPLLLVTGASKEYELLDSGNGKKLERFGTYVLSRPDPEALWQIGDEKLWKKADAVFIRDGQKGKWDIQREIPKSWTMSFSGLMFSIKPTSFKHTGLFPEQSSHWKWMEEKIKDEKEKRKKKDQKPISVLNLFAYTGGATLTCAKAGAEVCHVDGSKSAVAWARENTLLSGLEKAPIRWITDDVLLYLKREIKRGKTYDAIVMDPPSFGRGPKDEVWKIEKDFLLLMELTSQILSDDPLFVLVNGYTAGYSGIAYENTLEIFRKRFGGKIERGELAIQESKGDRLLPAGIFARWHV